MADLAGGEGDLVVVAAGGDAADALAGAARGVIVLLVTPPGPVPPLHTQQLHTGHRYRGVLVLDGGLLYGWYTS